MDAYQVTVTRPDEGSFGKSVWVTQPTEGKPTAAFNELAPDTAYEVQIVPFKGARPVTR